MTGDSFLTFDFLAVGLLALITVELVILVGIVARRRAEQHGEDLNSAGSFATGQALRLEITLDAPELVAAIRGLGERTPATTGAQGPEPSAQQRSTDGPTVVKPPGPGGEEQEWEMPTSSALPPAVPSGRPIPLVLRSRVGSRVENSRIGHLTRLASPDDSYVVQLNARLARDLVLEIAERLGLKRQLANQLHAMGNNEDPLTLQLKLEPLRLDLPVLDSRAEDLDFRPIMAAFGRCPPAKLSIERQAQYVVVKITH